MITDRYQKGSAASVEVESKAVGVTAGCHGEDFRMALQEILANYQTTREAGPFILFGRGHLGHQKDLYLGSVCCSRMFQHRIELPPLSQLCLLSCNPPRLRVKSSECEMMSYQWCKLCSDISAPWGLSYQKNNSCLLPKDIQKEEPVEMVQAFLDSSLWT